MHLTSFYLALSSVVAVVTAFPVDTSGTVNGGIHERNPSIPQYNGLQAVFARNPSPDPKEPTGGTVVAPQGGMTDGKAGAPTVKGIAAGPSKGHPVQGPSCPAPKTPLKKPIGKPPTGTAINKPGAEAPKSGKKKRALEYEWIYRRVVPQPIVWSSHADPTVNSQGRRTIVGSGVWGDVFEDPQNANQVIKRYKGGIDEASVRNEITALQAVSQFGGWWGYISTSSGRIYFVYMRRIPGAPMNMSPLWRNVMNDTSGRREHAAYKIKCAIWHKIVYYSGYGIRHSDLYQDNVLISGPDLDNISVDFVDWDGIIYSNTPITAAELEILSTKAMQPKSW